MTEKPDHLEIQAIGMVWYREADYDAVRAIMVDGPTFARTFLQWQDLAEQGRKRIARQGKPVIKCYIDPVTFPAWCAATGHKLDGSGRNAFAAAEVRRMIEESHADTGDPQV